MRKKVVKRGRLAKSEGRDRRGIENRDWEEGRRRGWLRDGTEEEEGGG